MTEFWNKKQPQKPWEQPESPAITLDEQAVAELQENPEMDIFEDEDQDMSEIMSDANLRLEMGRLYQMILQNDIFGETNADPKAIRNVQREIRKLVRERMEIMLGIRQERMVKEAIVSSPFNDVEVTVLKMLASRMSKGESERSPSNPEQSTPAPTAPPKKDGITAISGNLRNDTPAISRPVPKLPSITNTPKANNKPQSKKAQSAINKDDVSNLQKPIDQMTPEELLAHNNAAVERSSKKYAALPNNMVPHPTPQGLEMLYTQSAANMSIANPWRTNPS